MDVAFSGAAVGSKWQDGGVSLARISWGIVVLICLLGVGLLMLAGYQGYAALSLAVGVAAAINLT